MSNYKQRLNEWKKKSLDFINDHTTQESGIWLLAEADRWKRELDDVESQLMEDDLPFDKKEELDRRAIKIVTILQELMKRMELDQRLLHEQGKYSLELLKEMDEIDKLRIKEK